MAQDVQAQEGAAGGLMTAEMVQYNWLDRIKEFSPGALIALGLVGLAFLAFFAFLGFRAMQTPYTLLFSGLELTDAQEIVSRLEAIDVPYRLSDSGDAIMVPGDRALRLRMTLAEEGISGGGVVGYEIFDETDAFGTTDFLSNLNLKRALEGELARTIAAMRQVKSARVHLVKPERELFRRDHTPPSASVFLSLRGPGALSQRSIAAIRQLVAAAVPGLQPSRIAVLDDSGQLLAKAGDVTDPAMVLEETEAHRSAFEDRLRQKIVALLERSVGPGRVEAVVTAELDFDEVSTTQEIFDPESQVARSTQTVEEESDLNERDPENEVSVANNLPAGNAGGDNAATTAEVTARTEETVNFEISRTVRSQMRRGGAVERLSVAVQVDGRYETDAEGNATYVPRTADELEQLELLVRTAAGIDDERGDSISVVNRQFVQPEAGPIEDDRILGLEPQDYLRLGEIALLALVALLVLGLGMRPLLRHLQPPKIEEADNQQVALVRTSDGKPMLVRAATGKAIAFDPEGRPVAIANEELARLESEAEAEAEAEEPREERIKLDQIEGRVRVALINEVAEFIEKHPEDAIRVIRGWLQMD